jgi:predicted tellurium resistance membrane protein TerC
MSLDKVLAVAAAAREHPAVLFIGLALSVTFMGLAANLVARLIQRYHWIAWAGLIMILYVALSMIYEGWVGDEAVTGLSKVLAVG